MKKQGCFWASLFFFWSILIISSSCKAFIPLQRVSLQQQQRQQRSNINNNEGMIQSATTSLFVLKEPSLDNSNNDSNGKVVEEEQDDDNNLDLVKAEYIAETNLPTALGMFRLRAYRTSESASKNPFTGNEPCVIYAPEHPLPVIAANEETRTTIDSKTTESQNVDEGINIPIRVHDQCLTSEVFGSFRCDCSDQLRMSLQYIKKNGGALIYLQQEGRGIGLANKIAAYSLQDGGMDTVEANLQLGFPEDMRDYNAIPSILEDLQIKSIRLMTNNPRKVHQLSSLGVTIHDLVPMVVDQPNPHNREYLEAKFKLMNHQHFDDMLSSSSATTIEAPSTTSSATTKTIPAEEPTAKEGVLARDDGYCFGRASVEEAIDAIDRGEMVCVVDDMNRENEGDLIMAADACTPEAMAQIIRYSSGVICVAMESDRMEELDLPPMVTTNQDPKGTAFSITVDGTKEHGITTGISATDRSRTVQLLASPTTLTTDLCRPGHIFPLRAKAGGVLERDGHTEATVDLARLAGREPCGVLCEIVSEEHPTEMARLPELIKFSQRHNLVLTSIVDLQQYRRDTEKEDEK